MLNSIRIVLYELWRIEEKLDRLLMRSPTGSMARLEERIEEMSAELDAAMDRMNKAIERNTTVDGSVVIALENLGKMVQDLKTSSTDPATAAKIDALAATLEASTETTAAAVVKHTAVDPATPQDAGTGGAPSEPPTP
jgi:outer membrane murein-binding lipoprotein Lpp